jgi:hypothetical protein
MFTFVGQIYNIFIEARISLLGRDRFLFQAAAYGAKFGRIKYPLPVELTIGDDGSITSAIDHKHDHN